MRIFQLVINSRNELIFAVNFLRTALFSGSELFATFYVEILRANWTRGWPKLIALRRPDVHLTAALRRGSTLSYFMPRKPKYASVVRASWLVRKTSPYLVTLSIPCELFSFTCAFFVSLQL